LITETQRNRFPAYSVTTSIDYRDQTTTNYRAHSHFTDIPIPGGTESAPFFTYDSHGFMLTAINPPTGFLSGFQAQGPNSAFFAGEIGVVAFAPATSPPDNVITLSQDGGGPFPILSIDLARNSAFDPAPTVDFVGTKADGPRSNLDRKGRCLGRHAALGARPSIYPWSGLPPGFR
jgi:hypothetical protein